MTETSRAILILGMHRSGTSALTRVLNLLGAALGARLMPAVSGNNENGFWENQDAVDINEALLAGLDRNWHDIREMPAGWLFSEPANRARAAIRQLVEREFAAEPLWALKDPRMCRLAPLWLDTLRELGIETGIVIALRTPDEVAASLQARDGWSRDVSRLLWQQHMGEAEEATRGYTRCVVDFGEIFADWNAVAMRIARELRLAWPLDPAVAAAEIAAFIDPGARHHMPAPLPDAMAWPECLYTAFARARQDAAAWDEIARLRDTYRQAATLFAPCVAELMAEARTNNELRHYFETLHASGSMQLEDARRALAAQDGLGAVDTALNGLSARIEQRFSAQQDSLERLAGALQLQQSGLADLIKRMECGTVEAKAAFETVQRQLAGQEQRDIAVSGEIGKGAKQLDVQVLGDAISELARQVEISNQRGWLGRRRGDA